MFCGHDACRNPRWLDPSRMDTASRVKVSLAMVALSHPRFTNLLFDELREKGFLGKLKGCNACMTTLGRKVVGWSGHAAVSSVRDKAFAFPSETLEPVRWAKEQALEVLSQSLSEEVGHAPADPAPGAREMPVAPHALSPGEAPGAPAALAAAAVAPAWPAVPSGAERSGRVALAARDPRGAQAPDAAPRAPRAGARAPRSHDALAHPPWQSGGSKRQRVRWRTRTASPPPIFGPACSEAQFSSETDFLMSHVMTMSDGLMLQLLDTMGEPQPARVSHALLTEAIAQRRDQPIILEVIVRFCELLREESGLPAFFDPDDV
jgi:hypothetical protein